MIREVQRGDGGDEDRADRSAALSRARALRRRDACPARSRGRCWRDSIAGARGTKPPSLLLDLRAGKAADAKSTCSTARSRPRATSYGVPTPVNSVYARVLDDIAHMPQLWAKYRERPEALEAEVEAEMQARQSPLAARSIANVMRDPNVPESLEGWWILHRMFAFDRRAWDALAREAARQVCRARDRSGRALAIGQRRRRRPRADRRPQGRSDAHALRAHVRRAWPTRKRWSTSSSCASICMPLGSYVSVLELGHVRRNREDPRRAAIARPRRRNRRNGSPRFDELVRKQAESPYVGPRLWAKIPRRRYACFYPMNKKRGEVRITGTCCRSTSARKDDDRARQGRPHAITDAVTQVISGSIGFDDFEWGVDLYADDPLVFKKLVYEMRFDEASARYGEFGPFWSGVQFSSIELRVFLDGDAVPALDATS